MDNIVSFPASEPMSRLLSESAIAKLLGVSERHVRNLRGRRLISYVQLGRSVRYRPADVDAAVRSLTIQARIPKGGAT